jgi:ribonuclease HI
VVKAQALPNQTSNQQAEVIVLTHFLQLAQEQSLNIYTDSKGYAFLVRLSHTAIWEECRLLTTKGKSVNNSNQIMAMLKVPSPHSY